MTTIGVLSDTHGYWDDRYLEFFAPCDEVWHAGDIGSADVLLRLRNNKPTVRAVYGNADGYDVRNLTHSSLLFDVEKVRVYLTHIGGYPGKYAPGVQRCLFENQVKLFVCGHSHILKVMNDPALNLLHINPGAAGRQGFQLVRTLVRFQIDGERITNFEMLEIPLNE
ncbi:MAG: metallophosphoesterase family protein [Paludibacteraceae bacterium]|nr:metallophosphoesterase family protein [Paludibacteraceae bacterium]